MLNFKAYESAVGRRAVLLAQIAAAASEKSGVPVVLAVQTADIFSVAAAGLPVFAQHVDAVPFGAHTGSQLPEAAKAAGAVGTLLNHAEHLIAGPELPVAVGRAKEAGLLALACAADTKGVQCAARAQPDMLSVEPHGLISGGVSVSKAQPELIHEAVAAGEEAGIPVLCGAGIRTADDVRRALKLGAAGVMLASGFCLAQEPRQWLEWLLKGF